VTEGGLVPKNLYITSSDEDVDKERTDEALLGPDAIYHTAYAVRDFPHEVQSFSSAVFQHVSCCRFLLHLCVNTTCHLSC